MENKNIARVLYMAGFVVVADNGVVSPILPAIATDLHIDVANAGLLITAYMAPFAFFQLFLGITFLGQGDSMLIGGTTAFLMSWRGVFIMYAILSTIPALAIIKIYGELPQIKHPDTKFLMPYIKLIAERQSSGIYTMIGREGFIIIGSFSYLGAYISETYHFNYFFIGLIMTGFSAAAVMGGRLSGKLTDVFGSRNVLTLGLLSAATAFFILSFFGHCIGLLIVGIVLLGFGFIFTHSTLITRTTEFGRNASGAAVSLGAFT
jgi:predicted MFS family arabinose efflux permease